MNGKIFLVLALLVLFSGVVSAFTCKDTGEPCLTIGFDKETVVLEQGQTISVVAEIKNNLDERNCYSLSARTSSYSNIEAMLPAGMKGLCLNAGETTKFNFLVHAFDDADNDDFTATLTADDGNTATSNSIDVEVREDVKSIDLIAYKKNVCRNRFAQSISVRVKNNLDSEQTIALSAESELFLPAFEPNEIDLDAGDERFVELKINLNKTTALGDYSIPIFARAQEKLVESRAEFSVIDCEALKPRILDLLVPSACVPIEKGKSAVVSFSVKNFSTGLQNVSLATTGDLVSTLSKKSILVEPKSRALVDLNVQTSLETKKGKHSVNVWAWNDLDRIGIEFCVDVGTIHKVEVEQLNNNIEVPRDDAGIVSFNVKNLGDFTENVNISISNPFASITVTTQKPTIQLAPSEEEIVFIVIAPKIGASLGEKEISVSFNAAEKTITKKINFTVIKERRGKQLNVIKVLEYPQKIIARPGTKVSYYLVLENPTSERITDLNVSVLGLPDDANSAVITGINIYTNETRNVNGTIEFGEEVKAGTYSAVFKIENSEFETRVPIEIVVEAPGGFLSGLFTLASSVALGLIALAIAVFLIVSLGKARVATKPSKREPWLTKAH